MRDFELLTHLEEHPDASQRQLAKAAGMGLGSVNARLAALQRAGHLLAPSASGRSASLTLSPSGKAYRMTLGPRVLAQKIQAQDMLARDIQRLTREFGDRSTG